MVKILMVGGALATLVRCPTSGHRIRVRHTEELVQRSSLSMWPVQLKRLTTHAFSGPIIDRVDVALDLLRISPRTTREKSRNGTLGREETYKPDTNEVSAKLNEGS